MKYSNSSIYQNCFAQPFYPAYVASSVSNWGTIVFINEHLFHLHSPVILMPQTSGMYATHLLCFCLVQKKRVCPLLAREFIEAQRALGADAFSSVLFLIYQLEEMLTIQYNQDSFDISIIKSLVLQHWYLKDLISVPNFVLDNRTDCIKVCKNV